MAKSRKSIKLPQLFLISIALGAVLMLVFQLASTDTTSPNAVPKISDPRFVEAASESSIESLQALLDDGIDVNSAYGDGTRALHWAVHWDDQAMAQLLIGAGADVNARNELGVAPLWLAAENGSASMTQQLLDADANANLSLPSGETILMMASRTGNPAVINLLLQHSASVNATENSQHQTALMWAVVQQHPEAVEALVVKGADINLRTDTWIEVAQPAGARPAIRDAVYEIVQGGYTAFLFAAQQGNVEIASLLLSAGADVNEKAPDGTSALLIAAHSGNSELAQFLLEEGADPNLMEAGYSALHITIPHKDLALVESLLAHGANVNEVVISPTPARRSSRDFAIREQIVGTTPFWIAAQYRQTEILQALVAAGADLSFTTDSQDTSLMLAIDGRTAFFQEETRGITDSGAAERDALKLVEYSLSIGVDVNAANGNGDTGLHKASSRGYNNIVKYLVANGADIHTANKRGMTALDYAMRLRVRGIGRSASSNASTEKLLRDLGATD
ncbi:MAG: hypothetical protein COA96_10105 [SAR86 cluster bacterium]|uniref:Ankyrin repeat domain-containing protein n=1 Tax=SAR86 cluster bacterium TaxID=2030880 RepID=A0A2A5AY86_9GAMM|nr:MAG: hypothetical protein COA96_10105 [SAR86 cluster bacterium]